jgi:hypothetical protein
MTDNKNKNQKPLTLDALVDYGQEVLLPAMDERFANKKEFSDFKDKNLTGQDEVLKKLEKISRLEIF